jgi:transaldolase
MKASDALSVKIFADGADLDSMIRLAADPLIRGFTTNPTLMRKSGVGDYAAFGAAVLRQIRDRPVSFEVFADDFGEMERQAFEISSWGDNVNVKIPITDTKGNFTGPVIRRLTAAGVKVNVTALMTVDQVSGVVGCLHAETPAMVSVFAGRIADTGRDPLPMMKEALDILKACPKAQLIWASPRELLNIVQASEIGCHIITVTHDLLTKLPLIGRDLSDYSLDTVRMFHRDAQAAGYEVIPDMVEAST